MRRVIPFLVLAGVLLSPTPAAVAQEQPGPLSIGYVVKVKMDSALKFEAALKQHMAWLGQQKDNWTWDTWQAATGEDLTVYVIRSPGHTFADFDAHAKMDAADRERWLANVAQFTTAVSSDIALYRADISRPPEGDMHPSLVMVYPHYLKPGSEEQFNYAAKKIDEAIKKTNWPVHYIWLQPISGTSTPTMELVIPGTKWADFQPPNKEFRAMLEEAYGREEADSLIHILHKVVVGESSSSYALRPDLSYKPAM